MPAIIGTAGHIDHGKTALVRALTGQDTDRLKEEKERGISIDLGFAYFDLPDGSRAGIVDVPGHERFVRNMLAGAHGVDVVLLVVAADDGVMPQTEEHLEIVHLLGVERGIAVITKSDLVSSARVEEVKEEVAVLLEGTRLAGAPAVAVSSQTGAGLDDLRREIQTQLAAVAPRPPSGVFRMPVDRAFVMRGHGVVVTGTAVSGHLREGATVRLLPGGEEGRVRGLQVHGAAVAEAVAGQRVAINLAGIERPEIGRGHVLVDPRFRATTSRLDVALELRPAAGRPLKNLAVVRFHLGTAAVLGRVHLLEQPSELRPGERAPCQIVLEAEVAAVVGDRFVLRDESARRTLGGGVVLQPGAARHRRGDGAAALLTRIDAAADPADAVLALLPASGGRIAPIDWFLQSVALDESAILSALASSSEIALLPDRDSPEAAASIDGLRRLEREALAHLGAFHREHPLLPGVEMESLRSQVAGDFSAKVFRAVIGRLEERGVVAREESLLRLPGHRVALASPERAVAARAEEILTAAELAPPDLRELEAAVALPRRKLIDLLAQLEREGRVVRVAPDLYFALGAVERARSLLAAHLDQHGEITAATFRDLIHGSRKFSIALLDYFDRTGFTVRVGDARRLKRRRETTD